NVKEFADLGAAAGLDTSGHDNTVGLDIADSDFAPGLITTAGLANANHHSNSIDLTAMPDGPTTSSHRRSSNGTSLSSTNTPQRRIGPELTMEIPTMPNSLAHRDYLRAKLNEVIEFMESQNAKESVVAWTLAEYSMHFNSGCAY
ncbi:hypothetical protein LTR22_028203, partial [Elasticomyces elasticus]